MSLRIPRNYKHVSIKSGEYAIPKNIYGLLNAAQMTTDIDNYNRLERLIKSRHRKTPILRWADGDWSRADLSKI